MLLILWCFVNNLINKLFAKPAIILNATYISVIFLVSMVNQSVRDRKLPIIRHDPRPGWSDWLIRIEQV